MATGDSFDQFQVLLAESLDGALLNLIVPADDPLWSLLETMRNVRKLGRISGAGDGTRNAAGYEARWDVLLQRGGRMAGAAFGRTSTTLMGPGDNLVMGLGTDSQHLDPVDTPQRSYLELVSFLCKALGQITMARDAIEADLLANPIEKVARGSIEDATLLIRDLIVSLSWGAGDGVMATVNYGAGYTIAEGSINWVVVDAGSPFRFCRGQRYVAAKTTSVKHDTPRAGSLHNPGYMRCVGVNRDNGTVGLQSEPGEGNIALTDDDSLIYQGMWDFTTAATSSTSNNPSLAPNGVENLLINTGAFPDSGIADVTDYPELQAFIDGDVASRVLPEPETIDKILDKMSAIGSEAASVPPILIAEPSLWTLWSHLERRAFMTVPVQTTFEAGGGVRGPTYTYGNKTFIRLPSSKCRENTMFGLDPSSFRRFFPNDLTLRWVMQQGGMGGQSGVFRPVYNGRILTDLTAAEYEIWWQLAQTRPNANFIYKGLHSQRTYSA